ncbi:MAG: alpha/beta fold hydrolase [Pseudomonadota bacterium]
MAVKLADIIHQPEGAETKPPLVIAHGLFGSARNFNTMGRKLAQGRRVALVDMRNHGDSPWDNSVAYPDMAGDLAQAIQGLGGPAVVLGHSMGGKAAMALALEHPDLVAGLIVADIAPITYPHSHLGYIQAMRALDLSGITRRGEADPMLADAIPDAPIRAFILQNLIVEAGAARWRLNLKALEAGMDTLTGWPDALDSRAYGGPCLFLKGGASDYVDAAGEARGRMLFPSAEVRAIDGAGHWLHAERPDAFRHAVEAFLATL